MGCEGGGSRSKEGREKEGEGEEQGPNDNNQWVTVSIKDAGIGIDPEILPRLFTKFATKSEFGGTGLGLFICRGIIKAHNGRICADNNKNGEKGRHFTFLYHYASIHRILISI